jgi:histone deacetylase 1/2
MGDWHVRASHFSALHKLTKHNLEHFRYVYDIQESDTTSEDSDDESWHSDDSAVSNRRRRSTRFINKSLRKRMSLLTNQYFEIPCEQGFSHLECGAPPSKSAKRRFFQSNGAWDDMTGRASARMSPSFLGPQNTSLSALMERGGRESESSSVVDEIDAFSWDEPMVVEA